MGDRVLTTEGRCTYQQNRLYVAQSALFLKCSCPLALINNGGGWCVGSIEIVKRE